MLISREGSIHVCLGRLDRSGVNVLRIPLDMVIELRQTP